MFLYHFLNLIRSIDAYNCSVDSFEFIIHICLVCTRCCGGIHIDIVPLYSEMNGPIPQIYGPCQTWDDLCVNLCGNYEFDRS